MRGWGTRGERVSPVRVRAGSVAVVGVGATRNRPAWANLARNQARTGRNGGAVTDCDGLLLNPASRAHTRECGGLANPSQPVTHDLRLARGEGVTGRVIRTMRARKRSHCWRCPRPPILPGQQIGKSAPGTWVACRLRRPGHGPASDTRRRQQEPTPLNHCLCGAGRQQRRGRDPQVVLVRSAEERKQPTDMRGIVGSARDHRSNG
jgi:hypothetical protein